MANNINQATQSETNKQQKPLKHKIGERLFNETLYWNKIAIENPEEHPVFNQVHNFSRR